MEVVGLVASVLTITTLATETIKLSKHIIKVAKSLDDIADDMTLMGLSLHSSGSALNMAYDNLNCKDISDPNSPVYQSLMKRGVLRNLNKSTTILSAKFERMPDLTLGLQSRFKIFSALKWLHIQKQEFGAFMAVLESIKTTVSLIVLVANLELNLRDANTAGPTHRRRLDQDNKVIRASLKEYEKLAKEQRKVAPTSGFSEMIEVSASPESLIYSMKPLLRMSRNMRLYGTVSSRHPAVSTSPMTESPSLTTTAKTSKEESEHGAAISPKAARSLRRRPKRSRTLSRSHVLPPHQINDKRLNTHATQFSRALSLSPTPSEHPTPFKDGDSEEPPSQGLVIDHENFQAVGVSYRVANEQYDYSVTGVVDPGLAFNLMSFEKAGDLSLVQTRLGPNDPTIAKHVSGSQENIICKTNFKYMNKTSRGPARHITQLFFVTEHLEPAIIFGRPYVDMQSQ